MKTKIIIWWKAFVAWALRAVVDAVKAFAEKPIKAVVTTFFIGLTGWGGVSAVQAVQSMMNVNNTYTGQIVSATGKMDVLIEQNRRLTEKLTLSEARNVYDKEQFKKEFRQYIKMTDANFQRISDSLEKANKRIVEFQIGKGSVTIENHGIARQGRYSDNWIDATITPIDSANYNLDYGFNFNVNDNSVRFEGQDGEQNEIFSVFVQSMKDTSQSVLVGNFQRKITNFAEQPKKEEKPQSVVLNADGKYSGNGIELGVSVSFFSWNTGASDEQVIARFPEVGVSSDFDRSTNIYAGVRYNVARHLPLLQDLYFSFDYGYNFPLKAKNFIVGLGTTL